VLENDYVCHQRCDFVAFRDLSASATIMSYAYLATEHKLVSLTVHTCSCYEAFIFETRMKSRMTLNTTGALEILTFSRASDRLFRCDLGCTHSLASAIRCLPKGSILTQKVDFSYFGPLYLGAHPQAAAVCWRFQRRHCACPPMSRLKACRCKGHETHRLPLLDA
jgi:hypothetical protein